MKQNQSHVTTPCKKPAIIETPQSPKEERATEDCIDHQSYSEKVCDESTPNISTPTSVSDTLHLNREYDEFKEP